MGGRIPTLVGIIAGFGLSLGKLPGFHDAATGLAATATETEARIADWLIDLLPAGSWATTLAAVLGIMAPGLTALGLAVIANVGSTLGRVLSAGYLLLGLLAFLYLDGGRAFAVLALCGIVVGLAAFGLNTILAPVAAAIASMMALTWTIALYRDLTDNHLGMEWAAEHVHTLHTVFLDGASINEVRLIAGVLAILPFVAAWSWLVG